MNSLRDLSTALGGKVYLSLHAQYDLPLLDLKVTIVTSKSIEIDISQIFD